MNSPMPPTPFSRPAQQPDPVAASAMPTPRPSARPADAATQPLGSAAAQPDAQAPDPETPLARPPSYFRRHAMGLLPLWQALWVNYIATSMVLGVAWLVFKSLSFALLRTHHPLGGLFLLLLAMTGFCLFFLALFWGGQGAALSAHDRAVRTGSSGLAKLTYLGIGVYAVAWILLLI